MLSSLLPHEPFPINQPSDLAAMPYHTSHPAAILYHTSHITAIPYHTSHNGTIPYHTSHLTAIPYNMSHPIANTYLYSFLITGQDQSGPATGAINLQPLSVDQ